MKTRFDKKEDKENKQTLNKPKENENPMKAKQNKVLITFEA